MSVYHYLSHLAGITVKQQHRVLDILEAHEMVREIVKCYKEDRRDVEVGFSTIFGQCVHLGQRIGTAESMLRITG